MAEYIEREKVVLGILSLTIVDPAVAAYADAVLCQVQSEPAADVAPVRHGDWIDNGTLVVCNLCGEPRFIASWQFCPCCGAKMDGGSEDG